MDERKPRRILIKHRKSQPEPTKKACKICRKDYVARDEVSFERKGFCSKECRKKFFKSKDSLPFGIITTPRKSETKKIICSSCKKEYIPKRFLLNQTLPFCRRKCRENYDEAKSGFTRNEDVKTTEISRLDKIEKIEEKLTEIDVGKVIPANEDVRHWDEKTRIPHRKKAKPEKKVLAKKLRVNSTRSEKVLWEKLRERRCRDIRFKRQSILFGWIADFWAASIGLVIEVDGGYHSEEEQIKKDDFRNLIMNTKGITVLRFTNEEVLDDLDSVMDKISKTIDDIKSKSS